MSKPKSPKRGRITVRHLCRSVRVRTTQVMQAVRAAVGEHQPAVIDVALVDDATISSLHQRYMNDPRPTDVLTFDLRDEPTQKGLEGQIVVSLDTALRQAQQFAAKPAQEVLRYCIHGVLHLVGYDDHTGVDRRRMRREEDRLLALLNASKVRRMRPKARSVRPGSSVKRV